MMFAERDPRMGSDSEETKARGLKEDGMTNQIADPVGFRRAEIIAHAAVLLDGQKKAIPLGLE